MKAKKIWANFSVKDAKRTNTFTRYWALLPTSQIKIARDKTSVDIIWLKDKSLANLDTLVNWLWKSQKK